MCVWRVEDNGRKYAIIQHKPPYGYTTRFIVEKYRRGDKREVFIPTQYHPKVFKTMEEAMVEIDRYRHYRNLKR